MSTGDPAPGADSGRPVTPRAVHRYESQPVRRPRSLRWRLIAYPLLILLALWWARQPSSGVETVAPELWQQTRLVQLAANQRGKGLRLPIADGQLILMWWDNGPALAGMTLDGRSAAPHRVRAWHASISTDQLPDLLVDGHDLRQLWPHLPLVPWPQGWTVLVAAESSAQSSAQSSAESAAESTAKAQ